jgi:2-amino-4-hydroxy-6-hydroxymethyldihydropteridine diphosphokinase
VLQAASERIAMELGEVTAIARVVDSAPVGPSARRYANGALVLRTGHAPEQLLAALKKMERAFGRRRGGQRWSTRVLDLDIILWSGGAFASAGCRRTGGPERRSPEGALLIPHPLFRERGFVIVPAAQIAPGWRDPVTGLTMRQLHARLTGYRPLPR